MQQPTTNRHRATHNVAEAFWLLAGIVVLIASADAIAVLAAAALIITAVWWMVREIVHRVRNHAERAPVVQLRPALTDRRDLKTAHAVWGGPRAA